jgi:hypothetical protein
MTTPSADGQAVLLANAGWPAVLDRLLQGLGHDLNNRVQSLLSLVQLFQIDDETESLRPFLEKEVDQLEEVVMLLRLIPADPDEPLELIHIPDVAERLVALSRVQKNLEVVTRRVEIRPEGVMPVRTQWSLLNRFLLTLLAAGAWEALRRDRHLQVTVSGADGQVRVTLVMEGPPQADSTPPATASVEGLIALAESVSWEVSVVREDERAELTLVLPSAAAAAS